MLRPGQRLRFKRQRLGKTDYRARLALLKSGKPRLVVRRTLNNIHVAFVVYDPASSSSDQTVVGISSKTLRKFGWTGHCGNLPAAYLTGLLAGLKALQAGITTAVLDIGLQTSTKGNALYAAAKGAIDAGIEIPVGNDVLPAEERITGQHISAQVKTNFIEVKTRVLAVGKGIEHGR